MGITGQTQVMAEEAGGRIEALMDLRGLKMTKRRVKPQTLVVQIRTTVVPSIL